MLLPPRNSEGIESQFLLEYYTQRCKSVTMFSHGFAMYQPNKMVNFWKIISFIISSIYDIEITEKQITQFG